MEFSNELKSMLEKQKSLTKELETTLNSMESLKLLEQNEALERSLLAQSKQLTAYKDTLKRAVEESNQYKNALFEQISNERLSLINRSKESMDLYFTNSELKTGNALKLMESKYRSQLEAIESSLSAELRQNDLALVTKLKEVQDELNERVFQLNALKEAQYEQLKKESISNLQKLSEDGLTEIEVQQKVKANNLEIKLGSNISNIVGIMFVLLGVVFGLQYTYTHFVTSNALKSVVAFCFGILFLVCGELMNRKNKNVFSLGLVAGGISFLFATTAISYFVLNVLTMFPAILICILLTTISFLLSIRYHSMTIAIFAFIGGYLPITALTNDNTVLIYSAFVYFFILNLLALFLASRKKWSAIYALSFSFNTLSNLYLVFVLGNNISTILNIVYLFFTMAMYIAIILANPLTQNSKLKMVDVVILAFNTMIGFGMIFGLFYRLHYENMNGILVIFFFIMYFVAAKFSEKYISHDKRASTLFYLTALTFSLMVIPFQFGVEWVSLGWLIEGIVLSVYGILHKDKAFKLFGATVTMLCIFAFMLIDLVVYNDHFIYKYTAITAGTVAILVAVIYKNKDEARYWFSTEGSLVTLFKYFVVLNCYVYCLYVGYSVFHAFARESFIEDMWLIVLFITISYFYSYILRRLPYIKDQIVRTLSLVIYCISLLFSLGVNISDMMSPYAYNGSQLHTIYLLLLISFNLLVMFCLHDFLKEMIATKKLRVEMYPLSLSIVSLALILLVLPRQFNLGYTTTIVSFIQIGAALGNIIFGFVKRYKNMRLFGLGLMYFSVAKLFLMDLMFLETGQRILSFFIFGGVLIGISFVYQYFSKKLTA